MKHVLLTGAGGFVGSHVLEHLLINTEAKITLTDSFEHRGTSERIIEVLNGDADWIRRVRVVTHDLTRPWSDQGITKILSDGPVDVILNVASESHVDRSIEDPVPFVRNNVDLVLSMLELAKVLKPNVFVQLSTDEVYGAMPLGSVSDEWDPILPSNPYSASKAAQEAIAISYWRTYAVPLVLINCMNIVGERQHPEKFVPSTITKVLNSETVTIHAATDLTVGSRYYLHARNLADAMVFLASRGAARYPHAEWPHRYNVVGECRVTNLEMAQQIADFLGKPLIYRFANFHKNRPGHDLHYGLCGRKIAELGWNPPVPLWDSLRKTVEWTLRNPQWMQG